MHTKGKLAVREHAKMGSGRSAYSGVLLYTDVSDADSVLIAAAIDTPRLVPKGEFLDQQRKINEANARRLCAAWNDCADIPTAALEAGAVKGLVDALELCRAILHLQVRHKDVEMCAIAEAMEDASAALAAIKEG